MNTTLLWKDWRQNRPVMLFGAFMLALPYLAAVLNHVVVSLAQHGSPPPSWDQTLPVLAAASMLLSLLCLAVLGGNALAGERNDQSAEFLAALPVSRGAVMCSRAVVAITTALLALGLNVGVYLLVSWLDPHRAANPEPYLTLATSGVCMLGTAWLFSSFLRSPTIATGAGIAAPFFVAGVVWGYAWLVDPAFWTARTAQAETWYNLSASVCGVIAFVAGCLYYGRRVTP